MVHPYITDILLGRTVLPAKPMQPIEIQQISCLHMGWCSTKMSDTFFINSMLIDFQSENDLELYISTREKAMTPEVYDRLKAAGLKRQVIGKVWNKEQHRISVTFEYASKDAFKEVEKIYDEIISTSDFFKKFPIKFQNNRAVVLLDYVAD